MAVAEQRQLYAPFIESLGEKYGTALGTIAEQKLTDIDPATGQPKLAALAPQVAPQTALQQQATGLTTAGLGAYSPYVTAAGQDLTAAGTQLGTAQAGLAGIGATYAAPTTAGLGQAQATLGGVSPYISAAGTGLAGAGTAMAGVSPYITGAAGLTGPGAGTGAGSIASYMSPYQQQVIDTSLAEFDRQAAMRQQGISDAAVAMGGYGGGREGVMQTEYQLGSDRNRALLEAQLQSQGFSQAQASRQADMASRLGIGGAQQQYAQGLAGLGQAQLGLGQATGALAQQQGALAQGYLAPGQMMAGIAGQQAGMAGQRAALGQQQLGAAGALQGFQGTDISRAGQVGAMDQAYAQANIDATREYERMKLYEPMERAGFFGQGVMGLLGGMAPQYQFSTQPNASPLATALGIGTAGAGIYKMMGQGAAGFKGVA
jgi:hypothetical protein